MTTKTVASTKFDLSTTSVIMKATSYPDDNTYSFPQHDNMDIFIKEETDDCEQDRRKVEVIILKMTKILTCKILIIICKNTGLKNYQQILIRQKHYRKMQFLTKIKYVREGLTPPPRN